jgi:apolipoprotein N-acyltransferase
MPGWAKQHWPELLDLRWYGGFDPLGYSIWSPPVMALLGVRLTTALAYVVSVVLFAALLKRVQVARPVLGAVTAAVCLTGNIVVTRTTFALGLAVGLGALLALVSAVCVSLPCCLSWQHSRARSQVCFSASPVARSSFRIGDETA